MSNQLPPPQQPADPGQIAYAELEIFADYNSFYVMDEDAHLQEDDLPQLVDEQLADGIAACPGIVVVSTARRMTVPVTVEVRTTPPEDEGYDSYDHVTEASLRTDTGRILVCDLGDYRPEVPQISMPAGTYRVRAYCSGFATLSEDLLDGDDRYRVVLWPGEQAPPRVLKRYPGEFPSG